MNLPRLSTFGTERGSKECAKFITVSFLAPKQRVAILDVSHYVSLKHRKLFLVYFLSFFCFFFFSVLNVPLLVRHPKSQKLHVNIDPRVTEAICEAKHLMNMNLEVPNEALLLVEMENEIKSTKLRLEVNPYRFSFLMDVDVLPLY